MPSPPEKATTGLTLGQNHLSMYPQCFLRFEETSKGSAAPANTDAQN